MTVFRNVLAAALALALAGAGAGSASASSSWHVVDRTSVSSVTGNEGVATVRPAHGKPFLYFAGSGAVSEALKAQGWGHVGDPDSAAGYVFDDYQYTKDNPVSKMFMVTTPSGQQYQYVHPLAPGELMNNSYVTVSPDNQWMVSGEWETMTHLLVFPTPVLNRSTPRTGGTLPLAAHINLDRPVRDVQGCDFVSDTRLICATDDPYNDLFPTTKQLLQIDLPHALRGKDITGHVSSLGQVPMVSTCEGEFETEGVDYDVRTGLLRVEVIPPGTCGAQTTVYSLRR